jgi:peptide-methionine (S)-S-oxide reductase
VPGVRCAVLASLLALVAPAARAAQPAPGREATTPPATATATFAGGCFWCMQPAFDTLDGVIRTVVGYTGGTVPNPTYEQVSAGGTGHAESIEITFDPKRISYERLLDVFWHNIDPTTRDREFCDEGHQYRTAIFYHDDAQRLAALRSKGAIEKTKRFPEPIVTEIVPATTFYPAEAYHQEYYRKNPLRYRYYRWACGRDRRLSQLWGRSPH